MPIGRVIILSVNDHRGKSVVSLASIAIDSVARPQVALQVMLPEETLAAHIAHVTTHLRVHAVRVRV